MFATLVCSMSKCSCDLCTVQPIKLSNPMLSVALSGSPQPYYATNSYSLALQKVVKVSAMEEGHWHLNIVMGYNVTVYYIHIISWSSIYKLHIVP